MEAKREGVVTYISLLEPVHQHSVTLEFAILKPQKCGHM